MKRLFCVLLMMMIAGCQRKKVEQERICSRIDLEQVVNLFPKAASDIDIMVQNSIDQMRQAIEQIRDIPATERSYGNTVLAYEQAYLLFYTNHQMLSVLAMLSDDPAMQLAANLGLSEMQQFKIDHLSSNLSLYQALCEYDQSGKDLYHGSKPVQNFLKVMKQQLEKEGVLLDVDVRTQLGQLEKEIQHLSARYWNNIVHDTRHIIVAPSDLAGVDDQTLKTLHRDDQGNYIVPSDQNIFFNIMENCSVAATRKAYFQMYGQIAYPQNESILTQLRHKRQEMAQMLSYPNFAEYQISDLMMQRGKKVENFLWSFAKDLQPYVDQDYKKMMRHLPSSVIATAHGQLEPWDDAYVKSWYRKKFFQVNDAALRSYFPLDFVVPAMLKQFEKIFHVSFEPQQDTPVWVSGILTYRIRSLKNQAVTGFLMLDLYQRVGKKCSDACHLTLIPTIRDDCSIACVGASVIAANFAAFDNGKALLEFSDVMALFHEIGHGLHAIFGATRFTMFSGTQVVTDFVEVPSVMLEYWFDQPEMLTAISHHVDTGKPLSGEQIAQLIAAQKFGRAGRMLQQIYLSLLSYYLFAQPTRDVQDLMAWLYKKLFHYVAYDPHFHVETSFAHLAQQYSAAYYAYPLSHVIAADFFAYFKQHGLWNHTVGTKFVTDVLSPGGSIAPQVMIKRFLGRPYNLRAYLELLQ